MKRKTSFIKILAILFMGLVLLCACGKKGPKVVFPAKPDAVPGPVAYGSTKKFPVLMYHNLCEDESGVNSQTITVEKFRSDLEWLKDNNYYAMLPRELVNESRHVPENAVMITFDDGYKSNYELAFPVLKELGICAEISLITYNVDHSDEYTIFMNWDEVKEMSDSGLVEIGSHTHYLHNPDNEGMLYPDQDNGVDRAVTVEDLRNDLQTSADLIEEHTGQKPYTFSYPYGSAKTKAYNDVVDSIYPVNFGTQTGVANLWKGSKRMARYRVSQDTVLADILK